MPFTNVLTAETISDALKTIKVAWNDRIYTPLATLWIFLGQVLNQHHSCRAAVAKWIVHRVAHGLSCCSSETGFYQRKNLLCSPEDCRMASHPRQSPRMKSAIVKPTLVDSFSIGSDAPLRSSMTNSSGLVEATLAGVPGTNRIRLWADCTVKVLDFPCDQIPVAVRSIANSGCS